MQIHTCMSSDVQTVSTDTPLRAVGQSMAAHDLGSIPVSENDRLIGMITDRDIAVRGIGRGLGPDANASEVMSKEVLYCRAQDEVDDVLQNMGENQVRRLPVVDDDKRLVGIVSIGDLVKARPAQGGQSFAKVTQPSELHSQVLA